MLDYAKVFLITALLCGNLCTAESTQRNDLLEKGEFIQIPGPNPLLLPGKDGAWDSEVIETADAIKDLGTYYMFYHGVGNDEKNYPGKGYQLGVAIADNPLGPFKKYGDKPVLEAGPDGSWDSRHAACGMIIKEGLDKYYMWYSGYGGSTWDIGLATADSILGPWNKHPDNPILKDFGYVGGVVKAKGKYYMYNEHPIGSTGDDYGPMSIAIASSPEGPWLEWEGNPAMLQGEWGEWDDGGISEAEVVYHSGVFHMFYGGSKLFRPRIATRECIGYAYSFNGLNFKKYGLNPVATRMANPNAASFSEVHAIFEPPFIYLYHTLRYKEPWQYGDKKRTPPGDEDLGVQVLVTQKPFSLDMPVLNRETLAAGKTTSLNETPPVCMGNVEGVAITAQCKYDKNAKKPIRLHVVSSTDGLVYDTTDLYTFDNDFKPGKTARKTFNFNTNVRFIKIIVENQDMSKSVSEVKITATLKG